MIFWGKTPPRKRIATHPTSIRISPENPFANPFVSPFASPIAFLAPKGYKKTALAPVVAQGRLVFGVKVVRISYLVP